MSEQKLITEESFKANPDWEKQGLKVGDPEPVVVTEEGAEPPAGDTQPPKEDSKPKPKPQAAAGEGETVTVDAQMLRDVLSEVQGFREKAARMEQLEKDNEMLLAVADKSRLATYQARHNPAGLVRTARVWVWKDQIVKATVTVRNQVFTDTVGRTYSDQVLNVVLLDGTEDEVPYEKFAKEKQFLEGDIIGISTNQESGQTFYKLKFKDGKTVDINHLFIN